MPTFTVGFHSGFSEDVWRFAQNCATEDDRLELLGLVFAFCQGFDINPLRMTHYADAAPAQVRVSVFFFRSRSLCVAARVDMHAMEVVFLAANKMRNIAGDSALELA